MILKLFDFESMSYLLIDNIKRLYTSTQNEYVLKKIDPSKEENKRLIEDDDIATFCPDIESNESSTNYYILYCNSSNSHSRGIGGWMFNVNKVLTNLEFPDEIHIKRIIAYKGNDEEDIEIFVSDEMRKRQFNEVGYALGYIMNDQGKTIERL